MSVVPCPGVSSPGPPAPPSCHVHASPARPGRPVRPGGTAKRPARVLRVWGTLYLELLMTNPSRHAILSHNEHTGSPLTRSNGWISATPPRSFFHARGFVRSEKSVRRPRETSRKVPIMLPTMLGALALVSSPSRQRSRTILAASAGPATYATTASGLKLTDDTLGSGVPAADGDVVTVRYQGTLLSRATIAVGVGVPERPWQIDPRTETFAIGNGQSAMWEEAVQGMRSGGRRTVLVPPSASIRPTNNKGGELMVPAGDTIRFECELLAVQSGLVAFAVRAGLMGVAASCPAWRSLRSPIWAATSSMAGR
jgi:hypothetical protein